LSTHYRNTLTTHIRVETDRSQSYKISFLLDRIPILAVKIDRAYELNKTYTSRLSNKIFIFCILLKKTAEVSILPLQTRGLGFSITSYFLHIFKVLRSHIIFDPPPSIVKSEGLNAFTAKSLTYSSNHPLN